jgi:hypothetical protein
MTFREFCKQVITFIKNGVVDYYEWMKLIHSASEDASAKRFYGGIGFLNCIIIYYFVCFGKIDSTIWEKVAPGWDFLLTLSVGMIGLGMIETLQKNKLMYRAMPKTEEPITDKQNG